MYSVTFPYCFTHLKPHCNTVGTAINLSIVFAHFDADGCAVDYSIIATVIGSYERGRACLRCRILFVRELVYSVSRGVYIVSCGLVDVHRVCVRIVPAVSRSKQLRIVYGGYILSRRRGRLQ